MSDSDNSASIDKIKALADVVIGKLAKMSRDERNEFFGHIGQKYCFRCGDDIDVYSCLSCYDSREFD